MIIDSCEKVADKERGEAAEKKATGSCRMMNDVVSDDEDDTVELRRQRRGLFGFQVVSAK